MAVTMNSATFMGKNFQDNQNSIVNSSDLTLKKMFDISAKLVGEQDEISNVDTIRWEKHSWKDLSLIGDETVINLQRAKVYVFSDSVLCLGKIFENPQSNDAWEQRLGWWKSSSKYRNFDRIDGGPMEFEWNIFPVFNTLQLSEEVKRLLFRLEETPENFTGRILLCRCSTTSPVEQKTTKQNVWQTPNSYLCTREDLEKDNGHLLVLVLRKKWYSVSEDSPQGIWDKIAERMLLADVLFSVPRVHCPEVF